MDLKSNQNETTNHPDAEFLRFGGVLGGGCFFDGFGDRIKSAHNLEKYKNNQQGGIWTTCLAECVGLPER